MELIVLVIACIAFFAALSARKSATSLQAQIGALLARIGVLEDQIDRLGGRRDARPAAPDASAPPTEVAPDAPPQPEAAPEPVAPQQPLAPEPPPAAAALPQAPATTLEERLGTRWAVWVGGAALALGGILLVRYSIEQGVFGPGMRVFLGALFAAALVAAGEWFRRTERGLPIEQIPAAHVPSILTAAGTISAFGTVYAAHALYGFVGPAAAFVLLGAIGIATMLAAALHGPALAGLGLAGSFIVPMLVSSDQPSPWPVVLYLAMLAAAAYALARLRRWLWLAVSVVAGVVLWGFVLGSLADLGVEAGWTHALFLHTAVQLALAAVFIALEPHLGTPDEAALPDWIATAALAALSVLAIAALGFGRFDLHWGLFAVVAMGILVATSWFSAPAASAAVLAGIVSLGAIAAWPAVNAPPDASLLAPALAGVIRVPENVARYITFAAVVSLAIGLLATLRLERGRALPERTAGIYALAAIVPSLLALVLVYLRVTQFDRSIPFALFAVLLAADFYLAANRFGGLPDAERTDATRLARGAFAAGVAAAVTLALVMVLSRGYLTVAFAITAFTTAFIAERHRIGLLRGVVAALGFIVLARLLWDPRIMGEGVGTVPILNWLLIGYGAPALAFLGAASILRRTGTDMAVRICDGLGVLFAGLLAFFQIRHALNAGDPLANTSGHIEQGLFAATAIGFAYVLLRLDLGRANPVFRFASLAAGVLSAILIVLGLGIVENPLLNSDAIRGAPVFSSLMLAYLLPGLAAVLFARAARGVRPVWYVTGAAILAMALLFGYVTLEVRHLFQGEMIGIWRRTSAPEVWSYSVAWLALGLVFLAYGIVRGTREPRLASAALVVLAVVKVFLYDLTGIGGLWRALSVICLGVVLIGIGLAYQKLIFARPAAPQPPAPV